MPHQCLKCGKVYDEGSSQLLKGCSECKGTQFFYTKKPLTEEERSKIISQMNEDIERIISKHANKTKKTSEETKEETKEEKKLDEHEI
ncbi:MAG: Zn-ribbon containing protein, partial [Candidatus Thermoplasmatota archaeon]